jgi:hypothetical protein
MGIRETVLSLALAGLVTLGCGEEDVVNGFAAYGSGRLQGFVSRGDGSPVTGIDVFANFGPGLIVHSVKTDDRGLYELTAESHTPLDQAPFNAGAIECNLAVGTLADTSVSVSFAATGQVPVPKTVNFIVAAP